MATLRYSGELRIRITYIDWKQSDVFADGTPRNRNGQYRCYLNVADGQGKTIYVGAPAHLSHAVDSPEAFDDTARAALAFADDDGWPVESHAAFDETGYFVGRSKETAWPKEKASV